MGYHAMNHLFRPWVKNYLCSLLLLITIWGAGLLLPHVADASPVSLPIQEDAEPTPTVSVTVAGTPVDSAILADTPLPFLVHVVAAGETLSRIAGQYGVTVDQIVATNQLRNPNYLFIGQRILIYTESASVAVTPTAAIAPPKPVNPQPLPVALLCPTNTRRVPLTLPADPIHMKLVGDQLFLLANGDLYRLAVDDLLHDALNDGIRDGGLTPTNLMPPARRIGQYEIQELVYVTADAQTGDLLLLDKTNDIYRYTMAGRWTMAVPATPVPDQFPDPQYLAVQADGTAIYALDSDLSRIWLLSVGSSIPQVQVSAAQLLTAVDFVMLNDVGPNPSFGVLLRDGSIQQVGQGEPRALTDATANDQGRPWPAQLLMADETLYAVDGEARQIIGIDPQRQQLVRKLTFRLPNLPRLRSAVIQEDRVYALTGRTLYMSDLQEQQECPAVRYDNGYYFAGSNLQELLANFQLPYPTTILPDRPRSYPGARRLYRYGVHQGVDIYGFDATGLHFGSPVFSVLPGTVIRADHDYVEPSPAAYEAAIAQSESEHRTPPSLADHFLGRQVIIEHGHGVESHYAHLQTVVQGIDAGQPISQGVAVGTMGVSGTSAGAYGTTDGAHLHFEIWINGRYLGQGLSLYETMRLWQVVFGGSQ